MLSALGGKTQQVSKKMESCVDLSRAIAGIDVGTSRQVRALR
ncbi:hypothetical protein RHM66_15480 [Pseudomonas sp. RTB3]|nr:hypothetical protein RHM66_15480 [Pseudomonas sp. RTB3]